MSQFNKLPNFNVPLTVNGVTSKDWFFYWAGLFQGLPPGNVVEVTAGASPYTYTAPSKGVLIVTGGTVSLIEFSRDNVTYYDTGETAGSFTLASADLLRITHAGAPDLVFVPT